MKEREGDKREREQEREKERERERERAAMGWCCFLSVCVRGVGRDIIEKMMDRAVIESILHTTL